MEGRRDGPRGLFHGCNSLSQKIFSRASSSESLEEGPIAARLAWKPLPPPGTSLKKRFPRLDPSAIVNRFKRSNHNTDKPKPGLGTILGVLIPVMENMWGVLIFLRFYYIVGNAGVWQSYLVVCVSFACAFITTMSLSAVATNGPIEEGGTYYLISRALGPKLGGTVGIMYYLGVSLLAVLESLGAVEMLLFTFHELEFKSADRVIGALIIVFLSFLVYFGISFVSKLSMVFFLVVLYTMASYYLGLFLAPRKNAPENLTGLKWHTFSGNWNSGYDSGVSFPVILAIFFPCFTGILSGADRAKNLARPEKSIPAGTIGAVTISLVVYLSYMGLWAAVGSRDYLLGRAADGTKRSHGQNLEVVTDVAFPVHKITQLGIIIASMAQALQCLITSPRLLQAIANDGVIPFLARLSKTSKSGEPSAALVVTTILCILAAMIGSLDAVAPLVSICFLTAYAALNLSCFVLDVGKSPSWRPKWKFYHWITALVGFLLCIALSFVIKWYWAIVAVVVQVFIYLYIDYRQVEVDWGTGLGGLRLHLAVQSIIAVGHEARYTVNWRPQLLLLLKPRSAMGPDDHNNEELMLFGSQLKKGRGLCVIVNILEGIMQKMAPQVEAETLELENTMQSLSVQGFARVLVAPSYREGKSFAIQSSGLGALEPNTLLLGWPNEWHEDGHYHNAEIMLEILDQCKAANKASVLCMNLSEFPAEKVQEEGYIDVWWMVHDGGMLILLAHLLKQHRIWRKCKLRVHTISDQMHDTVSVEKNLRGTLNRNRIEAEVKVFDMSSDGLAPYTYDTTIRIEEAQNFARQVAEYRLGKEQQDRPELNRQVSIKPIRKDGSGMESEVSELSKSPKLSGSKSGDRQTLDNIFKGRSSDLQSPRATEPLNPRGEQLDDRTEKFDNQSNTANHGRSERFHGGTSEQHDESDPAKPGHSKKKLTSPAEIGRKVQNILKKSVPGELSMLEGKPYQPRRTLHALKTHMKGSSSKEGDSGKHCKQDDNLGADAFQSRLTPSDTSSSIPSIEERGLPLSTIGTERRSKDGDSPKQGRQDDNSADTAQARLTSTDSTASTPRIDEGSSLTNVKGSSHLPESESSDLSKGIAATRSIRGEDPKPDVLDPRATTSESNSLRGGKETRWADDIQTETEQEITVEVNNDDRNEDVPEGGVYVIARKDSAGQLYPGAPSGMARKDSAGQLYPGAPSGMARKDSAGQLYPGASSGMVRKDSAGQLYPGSPHTSDYGGTSVDIPEVVKRTWETFSQDYSPDDLNEKILEQSKDAQLVLLNLPDHYEGMEPARYMEYCEKLTRGLRRVLLVNGTGKELWRGETAQ